MPRSEPKYVVRFNLMFDLEDRKVSPPTLGSASISERCLTEARESHDAAQ